MSSGLIFMFSNFLPHHLSSVTKNREACVFFISFSCSSHFTFSNSRASCCSCGKDYPKVLEYPVAKTCPDSNFFISFHTFGHTVPHSSTWPCHQMPASSSTALPARCIAAFPLEACRSAPVASQIVCVSCMFLACVWTHTNANRWTTLNHIESDNVCSRALRFSDNSAPSTHLRCTHHFDSLVPSSEIMQYDATKWLVIQPKKRLRT